MHHSTVLRGLTWAYILVGSFSFGSQKVDGSLNASSGASKRGLHDWLEPGSGKNRTSVVLQGWNGGLGNNIYQLGNALIFAQYIGATEVLIQAQRSRRVRGQFTPYDIHTLFDIPGLIKVVPLDAEEREKLASSCSDFSKLGDVPLSKVNIGETVYNQRWIEYHCNSVPLPAFRRVLAQHLLPLMQRPLAECVAKRRNVFESKRLTVHLRGGDRWPEFDEDWDRAKIKRDFALEQFPCALPKRIAFDFGFPKTLIVSSSDQRNPCARSLLEESMRDTSIRITSGSLQEDVCRMLRARNLLISFSTMSDAMALLSHNVKRIFRQRPRHNAKAAMRGISARSVAFSKNVETCKVWPGTVMIEYDTDAAPPTNGTALHNWMIQYPGAQIRRTPC